MKWLVFAVCFLSCVGAVSGDALQITDEGRTTEAAFSPDGSQVVYLTVEKHFTPEGRYYFSGRLYIWDGHDSRILANLPAGEPTVGDPSPESGPAGTPAWLPSGDYIVLAYWPGSSTLFRIADGAHTRVGKHEDWFVMNDAWDLSKDDAVALNHLVRGGTARHMRIQRGKMIRREDLPPCVPHESENWSYENFWQSPADPNQALYVAADKHFDGCCCTSGRQRHYLGVVDLRTGKRRRLTQDTTSQISLGTWAPDGRRIAYLRTSFHDIDTPVTWSKLHVICPDGTGDRCLIDDVRHTYWASPTRLVAATGPPLMVRATLRSQPLHLSEVDVVTGAVRRLTEGYFYHELCDAHDRNYLVLQRPVGGSEFQGNLWMFRP